jgi:hypothetical protein
VWRIAWKAYGVLLVFYTILRGIFGWWNREFLSEGGTWIKIFWKGLHFDSVVAAWVLTPVLIALLLRRPQTASWLWLFLTSLSFALEVIDIGYFPYTHRRSGSELLKILSFYQDTLPALPKYMRDFAYGFLLWGVLVGASGYWRKRIFSGIGARMEKRSHRLGPDFALVGLGVSGRVEV